MVSKAEQPHTEELRHVGEIFDDPEPGYMFKRAIEVVKDAVAIEQVAAEYGEFKLQGAGRLLGHCVAPDHADRTPSLTIFTDSQKFKCFGCQLHGDTIDLERIAGRHREMWTAMEALAERYSVELPRRSERWHEWSVEKGRRHDELRRWRERRYQRRLYRLFAAESIAAIEDDAERTEEARKTWEELGTLARLWAARSVG